MFQTSYGLKYYFYFIESSYHLPDIPEFKNQIYSFSFELIGGDKMGKIPTDIRVEITIIQALRDFFRNHQNVLLFVCDSVDGKHKARNRTFNRWYSKHKTSDFIKLDGYVFDGYNEIFNSIIFKKNHPLKERLIDEFIQTNKEYNSKD